MRKASRKLTNAIAAAIIGGAVWGAYLPGAAANTPETIYYGGKPIFDLNFLTQAESLEAARHNMPGMTWELPSDLSQTVGHGVKYWSDMLGAGAKNPRPIQIVVVTEDGGVVEGSNPPIGNGEPSQNASALYASYSNYDDEHKYETNREFARLSMQNGLSILTAKDNGSIEGLPRGDTGLFIVSIGKYLGANDPTVTNTFGWHIDERTVLPQNEGASDFIGAMRHEMAHALGLACNLSTVSDEELNDIEYTNLEGITHNIFAFNNADEYSPNSFASHLVDERGKPMRPNKIIIESEGDIRAVITALRDAGISDLPTSDDFFVINPYPEKGTTTGKAYFVGRHVSEVLDGAKFDGVDGLPVKGWEGNDADMVPELSHIQTQGMMSHVAYSNYTSLIEAELAVMQDLGYNIDRRNYYGRSIYKNGATIVNTQGYSARNAAGTAYLDGVYNPTPLGVGLHIYGMRNDVTQAADILTVGDGAAGVRVDGSENRLTIAPGIRVKSDGDSGVGLLVSYGKNQTINQYGTVTATGQNGVAARFDFGSSTNGIWDAYCGSFIQYWRNDNTPPSYAITYGESDPYEFMQDVLKGPLVENYNLAGTLSGQKHAIYIGKNAFVKNINILDGAKISGNIKSDWLNFNPAAYPDLAIVTETDTFAVNTTRYVPALTTDLNFRTDIAYSGNISGANNLRLNVGRGELDYGAAADVVSVSVAPGATLKGGNYTVNYYNAAETGTLSGDSRTYQSSGTFVNAGTVAATNAGNLTIAAKDSGGSAIDDANGAAIFQSVGTIAGYKKDGGATNIVSVRGNADINNSSVVLHNALPNESGEVFRADAVSGSIRNAGAANAVPISGMLDSYAENSGNVYRATVLAANNLGGATAQQRTAYDAMNAMRAELDRNGDPRVNEMRPLYNLPAPKVKEALTAISSNELSPLTACAAQNSTLSARLISARLAQPSIWRNEVEVEIPVVPAHFADGATADSGLSFSAKIPVQPADNAWVKFGKNWGGISSADYHSSSISGGYDWFAGKNRREGVFITYASSAFGGQNSHSELYDTRVGYYTGWKNGASSFLAYADYGRLRTHTQRGLTNLGLMADGRYSGDLWEIGGEYKYDLTAGKENAWHVAPFAGLQFSYLSQSSYAERGAGVYDQRVEKMRNRYFAGELGAEFRREAEKGSYVLRLGVRHAFCGTNPSVRFKYSGYDGHSYQAASGGTDKTLGFISFACDYEFAKNWSVYGETTLTRGAHDRDLSATISLRHSF